MSTSCWDRIGDFFGGVGGGVTHPYSIPDISGYNASVSSRWSPPPALGGGLSPTIYKIGNGPVNQAGKARTSRPDHLQEGL
jgi:hypothetical protein